jgi:segregation and condensation protein B
MEHITKENIDELDEEIDCANQKKIEAALFLSGSFLTLQELLTLTDVNPILLKKSLSDLQEKYKNSGIVITKKDNMFKMDVADEFTHLTNKLATGSSEFAKAEQETLAMIAYKQPIKQSVIIKIRGNKAYDHIKKFVSLGLLNKKRIGHTSELTLTDSFFDYFRLNKGDPPLKGEQLKNA